MIFLMNKLIIILLIGSLFANNLIILQGNKNIIFKNIYFIKSGEGKFYFTYKDVDSVVLCKDIIKFVDENGSYIEYDCDNALPEISLESTPINKNMSKAESGAISIIAYTIVGTLLISMIFVSLSATVGGLY